jgi:hypothetical protein
MSPRPYRESTEKADSTQDVMESGTFSLTITLPSKLKEIIIDQYEQGDHREKLWTKDRTIFFSSKRFDRVNCNNGSLVVPKLMKEGRQNRRTPAVPRTTFMCLG